MLMYLSNVLKEYEYDSMNIDSMNIFMSQKLTLLQCGTWFPWEHWLLMVKFHFSLKWLSDLLWILVTVCLKF